MQYVCLNTILMSIPPEINSIVERLNQELDEIEQQATEGQNKLSRI